MKISLLILLSLFHSTAFAKSEIIMFGGGGEPQNNKDTQFDKSMEGVGDFYSDNKDEYNGTVNFNGGHEKTEKEIRKSYKGADNRAAFTKASYEKILKDLETKIETNKILPGEKILLFIDSHGAEGSGESHSISISGSAMLNMNSGGTGMVSLDSLKTVIEMASKKGIKLGIIDGSCHAGNTLNLAGSDDVCIIAASGPTHYSYSDFAATFAEKMKKGKNLEEIFLDTREKLGGKGFPMISTPAGRATQDSLYPYLTPYMYYHDEYRGLVLDKIDNYIVSTSTSPELLCKRNEGFARLNQFIDQVQRLTSAMGTGNINVKSLKKKIAEYKKSQDKYFDKLIKLNLSELLAKKETIKTEFFKSGSTYTHKELLSTDYIFQITTKEEALSDPKLNSVTRAKYENLAEFYRACQAKKEQIIRENPQYNAQVEIIKSLKDDEKVGYNVAADIMKEATELYSTAYKVKETEMIRKTPALKNNCKDFVL